MKVVVTGRVAAFLIGPDGTRKQLFAGRANTIGANAVGMLCYWAAHSGTSVPVYDIGFTHGSTEAYAATSSAAKTAYSTTGYQFVATATWTNGTGVEKTITQLRLLSDHSSSAVKEYAKLTGQSIVVGIGNSLEVQWTYIMNQNASGGTTIPVAFLGRLIEYFRAAATVYPISHLSFTDNHSVSTRVALGDPISGGAVNSTNVVWQVSCTAAAGGDTLAALTPEQDTGESMLACDLNTGRSDVWEAATSITVTMTFTPVTM